MSAMLGTAALLALSLVLTLAQVASAAQPQGPSRGNPCPPEYPPGATIDGGLDVVGECALIGVTINGGVVIEGTGHLTLYGSTVNGQTKVDPGGEFDSDFPEMPGGANVLNGGVDADHPVDIDLHHGVIGGVVRLFGMGAQTSQQGVARFGVCGVDLKGALFLEQMLPFPSGVHVGDPADGLEKRPNCAGNTISGSVLIRDNPGSRIELEANTIGGSVQIWNSDPSVSMNTIGGGVHCHQGGTVTVWDPDDTNTNNGGEPACG